MRSDLAFNLYFMYNEVMTKPRQHELNEHYFETKSPQSAYWAGFIAADGCVKKRDFALGICLSGKDREHLEQFKKHVKTSSAIKDRIMKAKYNCSEISLYSKYMTESLARIYGISERKSLTLTYPIIENSLLEDCFICGYIDGDGCINTKVSTISILGTQEFLQGILKRFSQITDCTNVVIRLKHKTSKIYDLRIYGDRAKIIFNHFKSLPIYKLPRKWERRDEVFTLDKDKKELKKKIVSELLNVSYSTLKRWHKSGKLPSRKGATTYYYNREVIDKFLQTKSY